MKLTNYPLIVLFSAALIVSACGGGQSDQKSGSEDQSQERPDMSSSNDEQQTDSKNGQTSSSEATDKAIADLTDADNEGTVTVKTPGNTMQNMRYDLDKIKVKEGQTIELTLKNSAPESAKAMQHNFVVVEPENAREVATAGMKNKSNGYLPDDKSNILAHTKILNPGESTTLTFTLDETGTYEFICTYPGHYPTMKGTIEVVKG